MPPTPTDADALTRAALQDPTNTVARLVLADWLEETGTKPNIAWAHYLRLRAEAFTADRTARELALEKATELESKVVAKVVLKAKDVQNHFFALFDVLPAHCYTFKLIDFAPSPTIFRGLREQLFRDNRVAPLAVQENVYLFAVGAEDIHAVHTVLETTLIGRVILVKAKWVEIETVLNNHYHKPRTVTGDASVEVLPAQHNPEAPLETASAWEGILRVIDEARKERAGGVEIMATNAELYAIRFVVNGSPLRRYTASAKWGQELVAATERLKWDPIPGVKVKDRNTFFGPGVRIVFAL